MTEKPISGDEEQRAAQTRAAREQSGLSPDAGEQQEPPRPRPEPRRERAARETERQRG